MTSRFPPSSRYFSVAIVQTTDGPPIAYLSRRFIPPPDRFSLLTEHLVAEGERVDTITAAYLDDPEQFWRVCDGNGAMRPTDILEDIGERIRITLPEGLEGPKRA